MKTNRGRMVRLFLGATALLLAALQGGCGGGASASGEGGGGSLAASWSFQWDPPQTYVDNSPLDPTRAIDRYEVFVCQDNTLGADDEPIACVSGNYLEGVVVRPVTSFDMKNLSPLVAPGTIYYVSVRAVGVDNQVSERSTPIAWDPEA